MTRAKRGNRPLMTYVPTITAILGITIVLFSVVFFFEESDIRRLSAVTFGLGVLILSVWYAANPYLRNARRYVPLREEVDAFIELVRIVHRQKVDNEATAVIEGTKAEMHAAVERMVAKADKAIR